MRISAGGASGAGGAGGSGSVGGASGAALYYQRVAPVVGESLRGRTVRARGAAGLARALEALGRTGVTSFSVPPGEADVGAALAEALGAHNRWEAYDVAAEEAPPAGTALLVACGGPGGAGAAALAEARRAGVPAVLGWLLDGCVAPVARLVWLPDLDADRAAARAADLRVAELDAAAPADPRLRFLDWLDLNALCLAAATSLLVRGGPRARPELEDLWLGERRVLLLHGSVHWPWEVRYPAIDHPLALAAESVPPPLRPALTARARVLLLGCGTGSLFAGEAVRFFRQLVMVDAKPFSAFNPVRQLAGTDHVEGKLKPFALQDVLAERIAPDGAWDDETDGPVLWRRGMGYALGAAELFLREGDPASVARFEELCDRVRPDVAVVAMGRSRDDNFTACEILRRRGVRHVVPSAFPGVTHYKHVLVDGADGPCYECLQNRLPVDAGAAPELTPEARELFYGGTQPATMAETLPSVYSLLRLVVELSLPRSVRAPWLQERLSLGATCFVGGNRALRTPAGDGWLYGVRLPHQVVSYGAREVRAAVAGARCRACGRALGGEAA
ncbi:MAG TPA: hypothetical protein VG389_03360 [Myxococcota bacterium]|jgi:hypothetical protein|nr:hypothetical protein [Myxococcota bacterium]